jgi:hypothetical protein
VRRRKRSDEDGLPGVHVHDPRVRFGTVAHAKFAQTLEIPSQSML